MNGAEMIDETIEQKGLESYKELAQALGVSPHLIYAINCGSRSMSLDLRRSLFRYNPSLGARRLLLCF